MKAKISMCKNIQNVFIMGDLNGREGNLNDGSHISQQCLRNMVKILEIK